MAMGFLLVAILHVYTSRSKQGKELVQQEGSSSSKESRASAAHHDASPSQRADGGDGSVPTSARTPFSTRKPGPTTSRRTHTPLGSALQKDRQELDEARDETGFLQQLVSQLFLLLAADGNKESYGFSVTASKNPQSKDLPKIALNRYAAPSSSGTDTFYLESVNGRNMAGMTAQEVKDAVSTSRFKVKLGLRNLERPDKKGPGLKCVENVIYSSRVQQLKSLSQRVITFLKTEKVSSASVLPSLQKGISAVLDMIDDSDNFECPCGNSAETLEDSVASVIGKVFSLVLQPSNKLSISRDLSNSFEKENNFSDDTMVLREQIVNMQKQHALVKCQLQEENKRVHQLQNQLQSEKNACEHWCSRVKELEGLLLEKEQRLASGAHRSNDYETEMASLREILSERQQKLYTKLMAFEADLVEKTKQEEAFPERVEEVIKMVDTGHLDSQAHKSSLSELTEANILLEDLIYSCFDSISRNERSKRDEVEQSSQSVISDVQARYNILMKHINEESISSAMDGQRPSLKTTFDQVLIVARHGERLDTVDESWTGERPYDPPLTSKGKEDAYKTGAEMAVNLPEIHVIAVSPFLRCVETAISMLQGLESSDRYKNANLEIFVDYGLSEWLSTRNMKDTKPEAIKIKEFKNLDSQYSVRIRDVDQDSDADARMFPTYPETQEQSCMRYQTTFERLLHRFHGKNVLAVTHGDAVAQFTSSALMISKEDVYSVPFCSYVSSAFTTGGWNLIYQHPEILFMSELE